MVHLYISINVYVRVHIRETNTNNTDSEPRVLCIIRKICIKFCLVYFVLLIPALIIDEECPIFSPRVRLCLR
jgi:hypothetical protein